MPGAHLESSTLGTSCESLSHRSLLYISETYEVIPKIFMEALSDNPQHLPKKLVCMGRLWFEDLPG